MLAKFCSAFRNLFQKNLEKTINEVKEKFEVKEHILTIIYEDEDGQRTIAKIYSFTYPLSKDFRLIVDEMEDYELSYSGLIEKLKNLEEQIKPKKITYIRSLHATWLDLYFLNFVRRERLKRKIIKVFSCKEYTPVYVIARKTEKANIVHVEYYIIGALVQEGYVPVSYLRDVKKLKNFLETSCTLEEV